MPARGDPFCRLCLRWSSYWPRTQKFGPKAHDADQYKKCSTARLCTKVLGHCLRTSGRCSCCESSDLGVAAEQRPAPNCKERRRASAHFRRGTRSVAPPCSGSKDKRHVLSQFRARSRSSTPLRHRRVAHGTATKRWHSADGAGKFTATGLVCEYNSGRCSATIEVSAAPHCSRDQ